MSYFIQHFSSGIQQTNKNLLVQQWCIGAGDVENAAASRSNFF